jgi:hypothetical protein
MLTSEFNVYVGWDPLVGWVKKVNADDGALVSSSFTLYSFGICCCCSDGLIPMDEFKKANALGAGPGVVSSSFKCCVVAVVVVVLERKLNPLIPLLLAAALVVVLLGIGAVDGSSGTSCLCGGKEVTEEEIKLKPLLPGTPGLGALESSSSWLLIGDGIERSSLMGGLQRKEKPLPVTGASLLLTVALLFMPPSDNFTDKPLNIVLPLNRKKSYIVQ